MSTAIVFGTVPEWAELCDVHGYGDGDGYGSGYGSNKENDQWVRRLPSSLKNDCKRSE